MVQADGAPAALDLSYSRLLLLAIPAIIGEAAAPIAVLIDTALISRAYSNSTAGTDAVGAFACVSSSTAFVAGCFNFVVAVTMAQLGAVTGSRDWSRLGSSIRFALLCVLSVAAVCIGVLFGCETPLYSAFGLSPTVEAKARVFFPYRVGAVAPQLLMRCCCAVLVGTQHLLIATSISVAASGSVSCARQCLRS